MNEREALLRAVCANPDEDTPRLVFADWLQENGEEDRAEFIRAQCELARLAEDDARRQKVQRRVNELQHKYGARWLKELPTPHAEHINWVEAPDWVGGETFDRGFAGLLRVKTTGTLAKYADKLFSATPVRRLMIWHIMKADKLAQVPQLRHLLTFRARIVSQQAALDLLECPHLDPVPDVRLSFTALPQDLIDRLRKRFVERLRHQP